MPVLHVSFHVDSLLGFGVCLFTSSYPRAPCRMFYDRYLFQVLSSYRETRSLFPSSISKIAQALCRVPSFIED